MSIYYVSVELSPPTSDLVSSLVRQAHGCDTPSVYGVGAVSAVREPSNLESAVSEAWHCGKKSGDSSLHNAEEHVILSDRNQLSAAAGKNHIEQCRCKLCHTPFPCFIFF